MPKSFKTQNAHSASLTLKGSAPLAQNSSPTQPAPLKPLDGLRSIAVEQIENLPTLRPNDELLIQHFIECGNKVEAFKLTYPDKAKRWKPESIRSNAYHAFAKPKIRATLKALTLAGMFGTPCLLEDHISELRRIGTSAFDKGEFGTARLCEVNIGTVSRLYVDTAVSPHERPRTPEQMVALLAPGNKAGQSEILEAIRGARATPVALDVVELTGAEEVDG
ncbi:hypothetical protein LCGC14_1179970 [marine sediment metagenome]|uniref:Uncharacterized protein n=1 Tax=marine sediment metagenome TaxID=412755 RepID=A0A0F9P5B7_9ZZZZ